MGIVTKYNYGIDVYEKTGGDAGRLFLANECKRLMDPYLPAKNLVLAHNVRVYVDQGMGKIHYLSPYAHYQYEGILFVSSITGSAWARAGEHKVPTDKALKHTHFRHSLATSHWDKAMLVANRGALTAAYNKWLKWRG